MINNTPKKDFNKYCEFDCPLRERGESIEASTELLVQGFLKSTIWNNEDLDPSCIKRLIAECLKNEGTKLFIELVEKDHIEKVAH